MSRPSATSRRRTRTRVTWGVLLVAPWAATAIIYVVRPELHHVQDTGLVITPAEASWLAAWLLAAAGVALSFIVRSVGNRSAERDQAETTYTRAQAATDTTAAAVGLLPPHDQRAAPVVAALLGAQQAAHMKTVEAAAAERRSGLRGLLVGADGRVSTSKVQATLWTVALLYAFLYLLLAGWHLWTRPKTPELATSVNGFASLITHPLQPEYLVLLGIPLSAAIAAKALIQNKVTAGTVTKTTGTTQGLLPGIAETVSDDSGSVDLLDFQYAAFNLVALIYFFASFLGTTAHDPAAGLPRIPPTLLALSGVSAATYATKKSLEQGTIPQVLTIRPRLAVLGRDLTLVIAGTGFCTTGTPTRLNTVTLGGIPVAAYDWSDTGVTVDLPASMDAARTLGLADGSQPVVITDDQGNNSEGYLVRIGSPPTAPVHGVAPVEAIAPANAAHPTGTHADDTDSPSVGATTTATEVTEPQPAPPTPPQVTPISDGPGTWAALQSVPITSTSRQ